MRFSGPKMSPDPDQLWQWKWFGLVSMQYVWFGFNTVSVPAVAMKWYGFVSMQYTICSWPAVAMMVSMQNLFLTSCGNENGLVWFLNAVSVPDQLWQWKWFGLVSMQYLLLISCVNENGLVWFQCNICSWSAVAIKWFCLVSMQYLFLTSCGNKMVWFGFMVWMQYLFLTSCVNENGLVWFQCNICSWPAVAMKLVWFGFHAIYVTDQLWQRNGLVWFPCNICSWSAVVMKLFGLVHCNICSWQSRRSWTANLSERFKPAFSKRDKKQTVNDLRGILTNWF